MASRVSFGERQPSGPDATVAKRCGCSIKNNYGSMEKKKMYRLICVQNGQYGFVHEDNKRVVLDHPFETYEEALSAATRRYRMLQLCPSVNSILEGTPEDFTIIVKNTDKADFTDHYFIE